MDFIILIIDELSNQASANDLFRLVLFIEFAMLGIVGINSLLKSVTLDKEIREHFVGRLEVFSVFFDVYQAEQKRLAQEDEEEEHKKAKLRDLRGEEE
jgi:regulator of protease activity HflC (stomatin/prohibitin superfamily)